MFYVYILRNNKKQIYIGYTADLEKRLKSHNYWQSKYTKKLSSPWGLVYYEVFKAKKDAVMRESALKNYGSTTGQLKKRIVNTKKNCLLDSYKGFL